MNTRKTLSYRQSGVDQQKKDDIIDFLIKKVIPRTYDSNVIRSDWGFAGLYSAAPLAGMKNPVLVACADGVGTKVLLAAKHGKEFVTGIDVVAMNVNDMIVCGARPLFFLDYIAVEKVDKKRISRIVEGIVAGCEQSGCALLGGETAEMPGVYTKGAYDLAGVAVGVAERDSAPNPEMVERGDVVVALASDGIHSNGFSLVRKVFPKLRGANVFVPTRIYVKPVLATLEKFRSEITALANITGGGIPENLPRVLNPKVDAVIRKSLIRRLPVFDRIHACGIPESEMYRTFNMGVGFIVVCRQNWAQDVMAFLKSQGETAYQIGVIESGQGTVKLV